MCTTVKMEERVGEMYFCMFLRVTGMVIVRWVCICIQNAVKHSILLSSIVNIFSRGVFHTGRASYKRVRAQLEAAICRFDRAVRSVCCT